jgi:transcriptional regulator
VPTWNYATVHACGVPSIIEDLARVIALLDETVSVSEAALPSPWPGDLPGDFRDNLLHGIVAFEIPVNRIEGKFKLGQNRSVTDIQGACEALSRSAAPDDHALARMMQAESDHRGKV